MKLLVDRPHDETVELKNGKKAIINCSWADTPEHVVRTARVIVEEPAGTDLVIGEIDGPISQDEANQVGTEIANNWYDRQNG